MLDLHVSIFLVCVHIALLKVEMSVVDEWSDPWER